MAYKLQRPIFDITDLSDREFRVLSYLASVADNKTFLAFPKAATIAEKCQCSIRSVRYILKELLKRDDGVICKEGRRGGGSIIYQLSFPGMAQPKGKVIDIRTKREVIDELPDFLFEAKEM